ncbi:MAG: hypothetical protein A2669_00990 [Candidatus Yanofskybacteria bacterium RIFCSPHIGHO2_01_FULL_48_25b]|uniref:DHHA1 domain-containing protein n=1 Tax=Candidatus Yanofskybacteria bacterium RIFCSPHIGHO2_01_FULL_48_25b TaxID=1802672 RepID=A0A1F8F076_9BACT|nr:MAG: hypothetical protein A2669_00990 [Candidatus Yanofskybacteria bacterium RIFCSPHIGHO2_01_FULL_48_25b]
MELKKDIIVFYHGRCRDGFTAAWAAWKKLGGSADYIPLEWTNLNPEQIPPVPGKEVYFLDYAPSQEDLDRVIKEAKSVVIIDHHLSKEEMVKNLPGSVYESNHSGAVLAWKYFHPDGTMPRLCLYVEDSDLWNWKIQDSNKVLSSIDLKDDTDFKVWDSIAKDLEDDAKRREYEKKGEIILEYAKKLIDEIIKAHAQLVNFEGHEVYAVNAPRMFRSEIGNKLATIKPPFGIVWNQTPTEISVSLRAIKDKFNLIPLAQKYGGGGHMGASNFRLPLDSPLPWKVITKNT